MSAQFGVEVSSKHSHHDLSAVREARVSRPRYHVFVVQFRFSLVQHLLQLKQFGNLERWLHLSATKHQGRVWYPPLFEVVMKLEFLVVELVHLFLHLFAVALLERGSASRLVRGTKPEPGPPSPRTKSSSSTAPSSKVPMASTFMFPVGDVITNAYMQKLFINIIIYMPAESLKININFIIIY